MRMRVLTLVLLGACQRTETTTRAVNLYVAPKCPLLVGLLGEYVATGDYQPRSPNHSAPLATDVAGKTIDGVPGNVQSLALTVPTDQSPLPFLGVTVVPASGDLNILVLPAALSCPLATTVGFAQGMIFGAGSPGTIVASGVAVSAGGAPPTFRVDLTTGQVTKMVNGLKFKRLRASLSTLGHSGQAIVAGGVTASGATLVPASAEIFDPVAGDFDPNPLVLAEQRADHSAVTLVSGSVLLVGGQNLSGLIDRTELISLDPKTALWRSAESTHLLAHTRINPYALRLADGTILVGGGFDVANNPVKDVEFFTADASAPTGTSGVQVPAQALHAFVALDGGGALFITNASHQAWFVTPDGGATPITPDLTASLTDVKLVAASGGRAVLWTGSAWFLFDPWNGFSPIVNAPPDGPDPESPIATPDPGMRSWVSSDGSIKVWRDSIRNAFASDGLLLATDTLFMASSFVPPPTFDSSTGLALDATTSATVFVADARFLDVGIDVDAKGSDLPVVVLRADDGSEVDVGGVSCALMAKAPHIHVERHGANVGYSLGGPLIPCATIAPSARIAVGVRGASNGSHAQNLSITRLGSATP